MDISQVNALSTSDFISVFSNIVEKFDKCAFSLCDSRPYHDKRSFINAACHFLDSLNAADVENVLQLHPDLAGKMVDESDLTLESQAEQRVAGLRDISLEDAAELTRLNREYKTKFSFPFIICARENKFDSILKGLRERLPHKREQEKIIALEEVKKITFYRISALIL